MYPGETAPLCEGQEREPQFPSGVWSLREPGWVSPCKDNSTPDGEIHMTVHRTVCFGKEGSFSHDSHPISVWAGL